MSDTPRTDALTCVPMTRFDSDQFARNLERENAKLREAVEMLLTAIAETGEQYPNLETETWNAVRVARAALQR